MTQFLTLQEVEHEATRIATDRMKGFRPYIEDFPAKMPASLRAPHTWRAFQDLPLQERREAVRKNLTLQAFDTIVGTATILAA